MESHRGLFPLLSDLVTCRGKGASDWDRVRLKQKLS